MTERAALHIPHGMAPVRSGPKRYLIGQFANPHGIVGRAAGWVMAHRGSNRRRNDWTVELLQLRPTDRVLEIGYGPGLALERVSAQVSDGLVVGLDHSAAMRAMAARRNRRAVRNGRLVLRLGAVADLASSRDPALAGPFDRIFAVNVAMFWRDPAAVFADLAARLAEGGRILVTFQPRTGERTDAGALAAAAGLGDAMGAAGLVGIRVEELRELSPMAVCVVGSRAGR